VIAPKPPEHSLFWTTPRTIYAVALLLTVQCALAVTSLVRENPTVDEIAHLPAGLTYWQKGTFRLYPHNPPLLKLVAAVPVLLSSPVVEPIYQTTSWTSPSPSQAGFGTLFSALNAQHYFEYFALARLTTPLFLILGGLVAFAWSSRLYGRGGGLLSLSLWTFGPNILAHGRLVTSDLGATSLGVCATFAFWLYLRNPNWRRAMLSGVLLGLAQAAKFSMLLLFGIWPLLWLTREFLANSREGRLRRFYKAIGHGVLVIALCILVIDLTYGFEGVGTPLGKFDFASRGLLTRPGVTPGRDGTPKRSQNPLLDLSWRHRVNRFRGSILADLPSPLPSYYLLGFDEQKIEADGFPRHWVEPDVTDKTETTGYPVYLDGVMRRHGWWYYYLFTLLYKVPEGTLALAAGSIVVLVACRRSGAAWADEVAVWAVPVCVLSAMSFLTDICLGLRYILPIFPYVLISIGKLIPWAEARSTFTRNWAALGASGVCVLATIASSLWVHPHYLAHFNTASGGPDRGAEHLIDSNIDWGQDLVGLREWLREHAPNEPVGLVYFGQINPNIYVLRGDGFDWFLPPMLPGRMEPISGSPTAVYARIGPAKELAPGLYAVSASVVHGLPWTFYDPAPPPRVLYPAWKGLEDAYGYFRRLRPFAKVGYSIFLYRVTEDDVKRLRPLWDSPGP
jgi:hypothetical protein